MKSPLYLLLLLTLPYYSFSQKALTKKTFLNNELSMKVSDQLSPIDEELRNIKYPQLKGKPVIILSTTDGEVNLLISKTGQFVTEDKMEQMKDQQMGLLYNARPDTEWIDQGMKTVNGKKIGFIKFKIKATDQKIYNHLIFINLKGEVVRLSFNCTDKKLSAWKNTEKEMLSSIEIKK